MNRKDAPSSQPQRRSAGGSRREASERVLVRTTGFETTAWALNRSRGGVRLIVEEAVEADGLYELVIGDGTEVLRGRVAWIRSEPDGQIVGMEFLDAPGSAPPPPSDE